MNEEPTYPATMIVHTVQGPVPACDEHARQITNLMSFMGAYCPMSTAEPGDECTNCKNQAK